MVREDTMVLSDEEEMSAAEIRALVRERRAAKQRREGSVSSLAADRSRTKSKQPNKRPTEAPETDSTESDTESRSPRKSSAKPKRKQTSPVTEKASADEAHEHDPEEAALEAKWARHRKERQDNVYACLVEAEQDPTPRPRFFLVDPHNSSLKNLAAAKAHLALHPQDDLGLLLGDERPIYLIFQHKRPHGYMAHLAVLDIGEHKPEILRKFGYQDDMFQPNKPRKAKPWSPFIGQNKAMLSAADLEWIRKLGPALVKRGKELTALGQSKPRYITLGPLEPKEGEEEETAGSPVNGGGGGSNAELAPSRILFHMDERGEYVFQLYRISTSPNGAQIDANNSRFTIRMVEFENLIKWVDTAFQECYRLAMSRVAVAQPLTAELKDSFVHALFTRLVERVTTEGMDVKGMDPELLFDYVAEYVRGTSSAVLKRDINAARGSRDNFQAYHGEMCCKEKLKELTKKLRRTILAADSTA